MRTKVPTSVKVRPNFEKIERKGPKYRLYEDSHKEYIRLKRKAWLNYAKREANKLTVEELNASLPRTLKGTDHGPSSKG